MKGNRTRGILDLAHKLTIELQEHLKLSETDQIKMEYGLAVIFINVTKIVIVYSLAIAMGAVVEVSIILITTAFLRIRSFGIHSKNSIVCTINTVLLFNGVAYLSYQMIETGLFDMSNEWRIGVSIVMYVMAWIGFCKYAPADTESRPLKNKEQRKRLKRQSMIHIVIIGVMMMFLGYPYNIYMLAGVYVQLGAILPLTYKVNNRPASNSQVIF